MKILFYVSISILWLIGFLATLKNQRYRLRGKLLIFILGVTTFFYSLWFQETEKQRERTRQALRELNFDRKMIEVQQSIDEYKKKAQEDLLQGSDYLRYMTLYLEKLNLNISSIRRLFRKDFILDYLSDIEKIPNYLTFEEWKDIEKNIYQRNADRIKGDFNARGLSLSNAKPYLVELKEVRDKVLRAKEEALSNNTKKLTQ